MMFQDVFTTSVGFIGPELLAIFIPIVAMMIPIVAILTKHQQKMAETIHHGQNVGNQYNAMEVASLRDEVRQLRELSAQQTIAFDNLQRTIQTQNNDLRQRLQD
jgi:hypothetical protein